MGGHTLAPEKTFRLGIRERKFYLQRSEGSPKGDSRPKKKERTKNLSAGGQNTQSVKRRSKRAHVLGKGRVSGREEGEKRGSGKGKSSKKS